VFDARREPTAAALSAVDFVMPMSDQINGLIARRMRKIEARRLAILAGPKEPSR